MSLDKVQAKLALHQALYNAVDKWASYYDYQCPQCDLEDEDAECTCHQGFEEFKSVQETMLTVHRALKEFHEGDEDGET